MFISGDHSGFRPAKNGLGNITDRRAISPLCDTLDQPPTISGFGQASLDRLGNRAMLVS